MDNMQEKQKLKKAPSDVWSIREQLCLASSVLKFDDPNWMSISRFLRSIADRDNLRPSDWYSQKSCVQQYCYLVENADVPKKKKKDVGETVIDFILRRLTQDRITELAKILAAQREEYFQLRNEVNLLKNGIVSDVKLQKMWHAIEDEKEKKHKTQTTGLNKRHFCHDEQSESLLHVPNTQKKNSEFLITNGVSQVISEDKEKKIDQSVRLSPSSSLLKSNSSTRIQTLTTDLPTVSNAMCSSSEVLNTAVTQNFPKLNKVTLCTITPNVVQEEPSASASTLSMLLEQPSIEAKEILQQQFQNTSTLLSLKKNQNLNKNENSVEMKSCKCADTSDYKIKKIKTLSDSNLASKVTPKIITNHIDDIMPKAVQMNKDEINEIIGDIEELIEKETKGTSELSEPSLRTVHSCSDLDKRQSIMAVASEKKDQDSNRCTFLSDFHVGDICNEEFNSSSSQIVEIVGAAMNITHSKTTNPDPNTKRKTTLPLTSLIDIKNKDQCIFTADIDIKEDKKSSCKESKNDTKNKKSFKDHFPNDKKSSIDPEKTNQNTKQKNLKTVHDCKSKSKAYNEPEYLLAVDLLNSDYADVEFEKTQTGSLKVSVDVCSTIKIENLAKSEPYLSCEQIFMDKNTNFNNHAEERKRVEKSKSSQKTEAVGVLLESKIDSLRNKTGNVVEIKDIKQKQGTCETTKHCSSNRQKDILTGSAKILSREEKDEKNQKNEVETKKNEPVKHRKTNVCKNSEEYFVIESKIFLKTENVEEFKQKSVKKEENKQSDIENLGLIKIEPKQEYDNNTRDCQENEKEMKNENEILVKKENAESAGSTEEIDEEESIISKLSIHKTMKTYSKKQTSTNDSEPENEGSGETADYKSWKKLIMSVYNTLATHKYASIFLRPITEDQAPGYHSIIFRPMDLSTVKKNIDNGTIRSTTHFQRDIMLMFQNAIMFNKDNTFVFKMTLEMREECLQHMQIFVQAAGEASSREHNRRETRTATNVSNDVADSGLKRKWSNITLSPHEIESPRLKKRKKSENDLN